MTDIELANANLGGHSICLCRNGEIIIRDGSGISPMIQLLESGKNLTGYAVADVIVGKAVAVLFAKAGIVAVYGKVMSKSAMMFLESHNIICKCGTLTNQIINRDRTGICPMEQIVSKIDNIDDAYHALYKKLSEIHNIGS